MTVQRFLKRVHLIGTIWFGLCILYILILSLREAGVRWWVIFSLSGPSAVVAFLLLSLYLLAIYKGASRSEKTELEYPLSSTGVYLLFYYASPFMGILAGLLAMFDPADIQQSLMGIAYGSIGTTFLVWILLDPSVALIEMMLPASRELRAKRQQEQERRKLQQKQEREQLFRDLDAKEKMLLAQWERSLQPQAARLAQLLQDARTPLRQQESVAVDIGLHAWQTGGLACMKYLHEKATASMAPSQPPFQQDLLSLWWDGIGEWRHSPIRS